MKNIRALNFSYMMTMFLIVVMTIAAELSASFKDILVKLAGHHWVAKGVIAVVAFFIIYMILKNDKEVDVHKIAWYAVISTVIFSLMIFLFFVYEYMK